MREIREIIAAQNDHVQESTVNPTWLAHARTAHRQIYRDRPQDMRDNAGEGGVTAPQE